MTAMGGHLDSQLASNVHINLSVYLSDSTTLEKEWMKVIHSDSLHPEPSFEFQF